MNAGLAALTSQTLRNILGTMVCSFGTLAIATTKSKVKSTSTLDYMIKGIMYTKAATDNLWTLAGTALTSAGGTTRFLLCLDSSGNASVIQASLTSDTYADLPVDSAGAPTVCPIGEVKVVAASVAFTPGTTLLDAAGITATYTNFGLIPATGIGA